MRRGLYLSVVAVGVICAQPTTNLGDIDIEASFEKSVVKDVEGEEVKSADVADALSKNMPSVTLVRRSAIANDIIVRGLKKDNISVTIDGAKLYGACPNRMDPPISHVLANNIDYIEVVEGPYDVTESGAMGASVKVHTLEPKEGLSGDVNLGLGRWNYRKLSTYISGGSETFKFELSASTEISDQYKDGNGYSMSQQLDEYIKTHPKIAPFAYQDRYKDMEAYTKSTFMGKLYWSITDNQELQLGYTANRSDDVMYPNSKMDADYDDSDLFDVAYEIKNLSKYSDKLLFQYYKTKVDHPMSTRYRVIATSPTNTMGIVKHWLQSEVEGGRIENSFKLDSHSIVSGIDFSSRNWDGKYYMHDNIEFPAAKVHSIYDVDTDILGLYIKDSYILGDATWDFGIRYDHTNIDTPRVGDRDRDYDSVSGNIMLHYNISENTTLFGGVGTATRVPDPKELYYRNKMGKLIGNPNLDLVRNYEIDAGVMLSYGDVSMKFKGYYNYMKDAILFNSTINGGMGSYENVDAYIYGVEISGIYNFSDNLYFDMALSYSRGKKDNPLTGQSDTDMPDIAPMHFRVGMTWEAMSDITFKADVLASARWDKIDSDNGEQIIGGWGVVNLKLQKTWESGLELTVGVDNLFDKTYSVSNTYKDLTLITGGIPMILNEPGRYVYTNIRYKF